MVTRPTTRQTREALDQAAGRLVSGTGVRVRRDAVYGNVISVPRRRGGGGSATTSVCVFGHIVDVDDESSFTKGISGGVVYAGDKVWHVPYQGINTSVDGEWIVWLRTAVTANTDDDGEVILGGIKTSEAPAWDKGEIGSGYPDQDIPTDPATATGVSIVAMGVLRITDGEPTFTPAGCGNIQLVGCPGTLSHIRL